jgi:tetratricopeptide (TPR) repeat protein
MTGQRPPDPRLLDLFDALAELDAAEAARRLGVLEQGEPALAAKLRRLLAQDAQSGLLDAGVGALVTVPEGETAADGDEDGTVQPGWRLGPFVLQSRIGSGGMGDVWRAERMEGGFSQQVAVKLLKRGMDSEALLGRFHQEREILARLDHPGIVRVVDGGIAADGRPWYAMDLVRGEPLTTYARSGGLDVRQRVALLVEVCDAVASAHALRIVHRDLKPGNILVTPQGRPRLLDFGIAKILEGDEGTPLTRTGFLALSPAYAAPEQFVGGTTSPATDVYALGVVLHELLTGVLPGGGKGAGASRESDGARVSGQRRLRMDSLSREHLIRAYGEGMEPSQLRRVVSGDLERVLETALRREPERRYLDAAALAADLRAWLDGRPVAARGDALGYRLRMAWGRNPELASSLATLALAVPVVAFIWSGLPALTGDHAAPFSGTVAVAPVLAPHSASAEAHEAFLRGLQEHRLGARMDVTEGRRWLERAVTLDPGYARAHALLALLLAYGSGYLDAGMESIEAVIERRRALLNEAGVHAAQALALHPGVPDAYLALGLVAAAEGRWSDAFAAFDQAVALDPGGAQGYLMRAIHRSAVGHVAAAEADLRRAREREPASRDVLDWSGRAAFQRGDWDSVRAFSDAAIALGETHVVVIHGRIAAQAARLDVDGVADTLERFADELGRFHIDERYLPMLARLREAKAADADPRVGTALFAQGFLDHGVELNASRFVQEFELGGAETSGWIWMAPLREHARSPEFLVSFRRVGMLDYWLEHGWPDGCTGVRDGGLDCA